MFAISANALRSSSILVAEACGFVECNALRIPSVRGKSIGLLSAKREIVLNGCEPGRTRQT